MLATLVLAAVAGLFSVGANAGSCNITTPGAATCAIPAGVASVNVVATGGGGGGGGGDTGASGGAGGVVTATLTGVGGTNLSLFVGGGGGSSGGGGGGGSSTVNAGTGSQIIAGGGGGGGGITARGNLATTGAGVGGNGNGQAGGTAPASGASGGGGGSGGIGGAGGADNIGNVETMARGGNGNGGSGGGRDNYTPEGGTPGVGVSGGGQGGGLYSACGFGILTTTGGGGGGGYGGGGGGAVSFSHDFLTCAGSGGGGGGSTGGVVTVASNGGAPGIAGGNGSIVVTWITSPSFVDANPGALTVAENAGAIDVTVLLHVNDTDTGKTETWTPIVGPSHGTLGLANARASSGSADIAPGGFITYTPAAGYAGPDSFVFEVSDGVATSTHTVNVTISAATVSVPNVALNSMTVGRTYVGQTLAASGGYGAYNYNISAGALPAGLVLNPSTGALSGTPSAGGAYSFTLRATDSSTGTGPFSDTRTFTGTVNTAPSFVGANPATLTVAENAGATDLKGLLHVSDTDSGQTITWTPSAAPSHGTLSIAGSTANSGGADIAPGGTISYTPAAGYAGTDSFVITVNDGVAASTLTVNVTISAATVSVPNVALNSMTVGRTYVGQTLAASGGYGAYNYSISAGALPAGLVLNPSTGALSGTPSAGGAYSFTLRATDSSTGTGPFSDTRTFTGTVNTAPSFVGANPATLTVAENAGATDLKGLLHVSDTDSGQTITWTPSAAPSHGTLSIAGSTANSGGADIAPGGTISYTPTAGYAGTDSFVIAVNDGVASSTLTINVAVNGTTIHVAALSLNSMTVGKTYVSQFFTATGGYGAYSYTVSAGALPAGLVLNASTGALSGTPSASGIYQFTIRATDSSTGTGPFSGTRAFDSAVAVAPVTGIPGVVTPPLITNLPTAVQAKDLNSGQGPDMTVCLTDAVSTLLGEQATYQGQGADGGARLSLATKPVQWLSFYPMDADTSSSNPTLALTGGNALNVLTRCGTFTTLPALFNRGEFGAVLNTMGLTATTDLQGVVTIQSGNTIYVARPDYVVTPGTAGAAPGLVQGADGQFRFTDSAGYVQVLRPALLEPQVLRTALISMLGNQFGSFVIQTDGTALLTLTNGAVYVLTPSLTLDAVPAAHSVDSAWMDASGTGYRVYSVPNASQAITVTPR